MTNPKSKMHRRILLILSLFVIAVSINARTFRLFILSGQSNALGNGNGDLLPDSLKLVDPTVVMWDDLTRAWQPLKPRKTARDTAKNVDSLKFGPELMFAHKMKIRWPGDIIGIVKQVRGGTSIIAWDSEYKTAKWIADMKMVGHITATDSVLPQWPILEKYYKQALAVCSTRTDIDSIRISGFLWGQGEHDGMFDSAAQAYQANLVKLIGNVRRLTGQPNLPTMFMDSHAGTPTNKETIHAALVKITESIPATALVLDRDLTTYSDNIHFDTMGMLEFGNRFALAYFMLWNKQNTTSLYQTLSPSINVVRSAMRVSMQGCRMAISEIPPQRQAKRVFNCLGSALVERPNSLSH